MATKKPIKKQQAKKPTYKVIIRTTDLSVARAFAVLAKQACNAAPDVTTFDAPLPGCGGPGDPC